MELSLVDFEFSKYRLEIVARPAGFEPATYGLEGRCTIRLCYERLGRQYAIADHCAQVANMGIL
jgi:hypothetical protein